MLPQIGIIGLPGYILLGIGSWKAKKLPRWTTVLGPTGWVLSMVSMALFVSGLEVAYDFPAVGLVIWGIGLIGAGVRLWTVTVEPARKPEAAT